MATINEMIAYYRKANGWSQAELAKRLKVKPSTVGNYELGIRTPHGEIEEALADIFNVSLDNLRGIDTERRPQVPNIKPEYIDLIDKYDRLSDAQKETVLNTINLFLSDNK